MKQRLEVVLVMLVLSSVAAHGQDITIDGTARSVSLFAAIANYCPSHMKVNTELARNYVKAYTEVGIKTEGQRPFEGRVKKETARRTQEVEITGPLQWCERQRAFIRSVGDNKLFP